MASSQHLKKHKSANAFEDYGNPLDDFTLPQVKTLASKFARDHKLPEETIVKGGALVWHENSPDASIGLTELEIDAVKQDVKSPWSGQKKMLYFTIILNSLAGTIQGWDQTGTNGANLVFPRFLGIPVDACSEQCARPHPGYCGTNLLRVGFVNGTPYITIALIAAWLSDPINNHLGRRGTIFIGVIFSLIAPLGSGFTKHWYQLVACRVLLGLGMGLKETTVPIFSAEIAPNRIRGRLVMSWQICTAAGILLGSIANIVCYYITDDLDKVWRFQLSSALIPAVPLILGLWFCPESPRYLIKKDRIKAAYEALKDLRKHEILAARDLIYIYADLHYKSNSPVQNRAFLDIIGGLKHFWGLFSDPPVKRATWAAAIVMAAQQLCGVNIFAFYSSNIFVSTNLGSDASHGICGINTSGSNISQALHDQIRKENNTALGLTAGFAAVWLFLAIPGFWGIERIGRRRLLLWTIPAMSLSILIAGQCFRAKYNTVPVVVFLFIFAACYAPAMGPIPFTYSAEIFPMSHREIGMSWAVVINNLVGSVIALTFPYIYQNFTRQGAFGFFAALNVVAYILVFLFVPETAQLTLEDLSHKLAMPKFSERHIEYHLFELTRWRYHNAVYGKEYQEERPPFSNQSSKAKKTTDEATGPTDEAAEN